MPILSIQTDFIGQTDTAPNIIIIYTSDDNATITATGYLTGAMQNGYIFSNAQMAVVYGTDLVDGNEGCALYSVQIVEGVVSLVAASGGGGGSVNSVMGDGTTISTTGSTNVTVSIDDAYAGQSSITTLGTIGAGTWNGTAITGQYGGTGVANTGKTITLGGNFTTSGAYPLTATLTGSTNVTFPTSGTLATTSSGIQSVSGTSSQIDVTSGQNPVISIDSGYVGQTSITTLGTIGTGTWAGTTVATGHGGTGVTSVTTAPTASAFAGWDAHSNLSANNFIQGYATTATAGGTTTLTVSSAQLQYFTGSSNQTVVLPVVSTLVLGQKFYIINQSSGTITVNSSGGNEIVAMLPTTQLTVTCIGLVSTSASSWYPQLETQSVALGSSGQVWTSNGSSALPTFQNVSGTGTITNVGDVSSGAAFNGTAGTTLTSTASGFEITVATNSGTPGDINIVGANGTTSGSGSNVILQAGSGAGSGAGGNIGGYAGTGGTTGNGGGFYLEGGVGGSTSGNGGFCNLNGGAATSGTGGSILIYPGLSAAGAGGNVTIGGGHSGGTNANAGNTIFKGSAGTGTGQPGYISFEGAATSVGSGTSVQPLVNRLYLNASVKGLTSGTATDLFSLNLSNGTTGAGMLYVCVECNDGSNYQIVMNEYSYCAYQDTSGDVNMYISGGAASTIATAGTLTLSMNQDGSAISVTPTTSGLGAPVVFKATYTIMNHSQTDITVP